MRELFIGFIAALIIGSLANGLGWYSSLGFQIQNPVPESQQGEDGASQTPPQANAAAPGQEIASVDEKDFQKDVLENNKPVLVDFYSQTCPHCRKMFPLVEQLANDYRGALTIAKVDVMAEPALAEKYSVRELPAFVVFRDGKQVGTMTGEMTADEMKTQLLTPLLNSAAAEPDATKGG